MLSGFAVSFYLHSGSKGPQQGMQCLVSRFGIIVLCDLQQNGRRPSSGIRQML